MILLPWDHSLVPFWLLPLISLLSFNGFLSSFSWPHLVPFPQIDDCQNFPVNLIYHTADNEEQEMEVFPQWSQVPMSKMLTFYRKESFALQAVYGSSRWVFSVISLNESEFIGLMFVVIACRKTERWFALSYGYDRPLYCQGRRSNARRRCLQGQSKGEFGRD